MFHGDGYACLRVPKPDRVSLNYLSVSQLVERDLSRATQEDELGQLYLSNIDFLKNGIPASIIATLVTNSSSVSCSRSMLIHGAGRRDRWISSHASNWVRIIVFFPPTSLLTAATIVIIRL